MSKLDPKYASPSKYAQLADCPMKFWIFNLHPKRDSFKSKNMTIGHIVDQSLHRFFGRPEDSRSLEALKAEFDLVWLQAKAEPRNWAILPSEEVEARAEAWQILEAFSKTFDTRLTPLYIPPLDSVPNRWDFMIEYDLTPELTIRGYGDRLDKTDSGYEVIDYKTKGGAELYEEKNNLQLRMYALLFEKWLKSHNLDGVVDKIAFLYLTPRGVEKRDFVFTEEDRATTIAEVKNLQRVIKDLYSKYGESPWPCKGDHCGRLLKTMEARAEQWARESVAATQPQLPTVQDIPF